MSTVLARDARGRQRAGEPEPTRLVSAPWVLPIVTPPIADGALVLGGPAGDTILACGARAELRRELPAVPEERAAGALLPGLVNAHTHLELSAYAPDGPLDGGAGLIPWTRALMARRSAPEPRVAARGPEGDGDAHLLAAARSAALSARAMGTAAIGDVGNGTAGWRALDALGFRGLFFHELVGSREVATGDALADAARERADARAGSARLARQATDRDRSRHRHEEGGDGDGVSPDGVPAVPAPHALYSVGPTLLRRIFAAAAATGHPTSIHVAEDAAELELLRHGRGPWIDILRAMGVPDGARAPGLGPTAYLERLGAFDGPSPPLLVHMVHADAADLRRARAGDATVVVCARSNLHLADRLPDVPVMLEMGVRLALGTDSLASAPDLSLWQEISVLAHHFPDVPPRAWLHAATRGGALALGLAGASSGRPAPALGAFVPGARPGVLAVSLPASCDTSTSAGAVERALVSAPTPTLTWISAA